MKKYLFIIAISMVVSSCGGGGGDNPPPEPPPVANKAPNTPTQSAPANNLLCIDNTVSFQWNASTDPEGDAISYELQIATDNQFSLNLQTRTSTSTSISVSLEKGVAYYWRIKAKDSKNAASSYSSTYNFYTEGDGESNHVPFSPVLVAPVLNAVVQTSTATLEWTASDVDNNPLKFDIYFDTANPPTTKIAENQSEITLNKALDASTNYYWKVVVKDDKGGVTIGQVWNFKTD
jgi:hypothetical protein